MYVSSNDEYRFACMHIRSIYLHTLCYGEKGRREEERISDVKREGVAVQILRGVIGERND
jgi:hypothetical protein